jgi:hypothetical protein
MRTLIYRGTPPVGPAETQALLASEFAAIWSPPMYRHTSAAGGDRVALIWQSGAGRSSIAWMGHPDRHT